MDKLGIQFIVKDVLENLFYGSIINFVEENLIMILKFYLKKWLHITF